MHRQFDELDPEYDVPEKDFWFSTGSAAYALGILHEQTKKIVEKRARKPVRFKAVGDHWPRRAVMRFIYKATIKEAGVEYLIYKHRDIVRYVPALAQPPRVLYGNGGVGMREPVLVSEKPDVAVERLGLLRYPRTMTDYALVDHPDIDRATMMVFPVSLPDYAADRADLEVEVAQAEKEFESTRATPQFRSWFEGAAGEVRNEDGSPKVFYRGQTGVGNKSRLQSRLVMDSFTDSSEIATIYSSKGGEMQSGSNVLPVYIDMKNPLVIPYGSLTLYDMLGMLGYWDGTGITHSEVTKIFNYLIKRKLASAAQGSMFGFSTRLPKSLRNFAGMPSFNYQIKQEEDTDDGAYEDDPIEIEGDIFGGRTDLHAFRDLWDESGWDDQDLMDEELIDYQKRLSLLINIDVYAFIETPAVKRALKKLGYDGVKHIDLFAAKDAARAVLDKDIKDVEGIEEGYEDYDWEDMSYDYGHWTLRPLDRSQVWPIQSDKPIKVAARAVKRALLAVARMR